MSTRPVIFISAVSRELHTARDLIAKTLLALGYEPKWQDIAATDTGDLRAVLRKWIDDSDAVIQLIGHCYGFAPTSPDPHFGPCSYTQYETLYARQQGKKVYFIFTVAPHPKDGCACKPDPKPLHDLQKTYRQTVKSYGDLYHSTSSLIQTELIVRRLKDDLGELRKEAQLSQDLLHHKTDQLLDHQKQSNAAIADLRQQFENFIKGGSEQDLQHDYDTLLHLVAARHGQTPEALVAEMRQRAYSLVADPSVELQTKISALREAGEFIKARDFAIEAAQHLAALRKKATHDEAQMWTEAAQTELTLGHYAEALLHAEKAVSLTNPEADFPIWSAARHQQGWALNRLRKDKEAQALYEELIPLQIDAFGADNIAVLQSRRTLIISLDGRGNYTLAEQQGRILVGDCQRVLGAEHFDTLASRNSLAVLLDSLGKYSEAEQEQRAVLQIKERVLGAEHPDSLMSRNNLAIALDAQGKHAEAEREKRAVFKVQMRVLGAEHPSTLMSRMNLANTLYFQSHYAEAAQGHLAVLHVRKRVLGAEHPSTLMSRMRFALALNAQGKHAEAEKEYRAVLKIQGRILGMEHPETLSSRGNLAAALHGQGKHAEAEQENRTRIKIEERVLGAQHPGVATSCYYLALFLKAQQKLPEALSFMQRAEQIETKVLGPDHPDTKDTKTQRERIEAALK